MSNFPDAHKVYDLAAVFRERVIEQGRSFLWPDQEIWTVENAERLLELEAGRALDETSRSFSALAKAISAESTTLCMLAADAQAACHLYWASTELNFEHRMGAFLGQDGMPPVYEKTWELLKEQTYVGVPGSYTVNKSYYYDFHLSAVSAIFAMRAGLSADPTTEQIESAVKKEMSEPRSSRAREHYIWQFAHVFFPDQIVALPSQRARNLVLNAFGDHSGISKNTSEFAKLNAIREYLRPRFGEDYVDFYDRRVYLEWENDKYRIKSWKNFWGHDQPVAPRPVVADEPYQVANLFRTRVIDQGKSLLWLNSSLWSPNSIDEFIVAFEEMLKVEGGWLETYRNHFSKLNGNQQELLADAFGLLMQFPSIDSYGLQLKRDQLDVILNMGTDDPIDEQTLQMVHQGFGVGVGSPGTYFTTTVHYQVAYVVLFMREYLKLPDLGIQGAADSALNWVKSNPQYSKGVGPARNILLHLFEPERYEPVASQDHKVKITARFGPLIDDQSAESTVDLDERIRIIRQVLENKHFGPKFNFYHAMVVPFWLGERPLDELPLLGSGPTQSPPPIADLTAATHLDQTFLREIEALLKDKKQLIFEGPPGSGKTFVADKFARYFAGQPLDSDESNEQIELVQFHQSYSYEDFVEGIRPDTNEDGQLVYKTVPGIFREFADLAKLNPDKKFVLIIDEINRGNVSRILGELMLLLEYRHKSARLPYSKELLKIPDNLYIIGTMNSADRSLSQIDYALRRRFYFVRFMAVENNIAQVLQSWLAVNGIDATRVLPLFLRLNALLEEHVGTDDLQVGHSYFMREGINLEAVQEQVWKYAVMPLLREYLYHHRERDSVLAKFELLRGGAPPVTLAEPSGEVGSEPDTDIDAFVDDSNHE